MQSSIQCNVAAIKGLTRFYSCSPSDTCQQLSGCGTHSYPTTGFGFGFRCGASWLGCPAGWVSGWLGVRLAGCTEVLVARPRRRDWGRQVERVEWRQLQNNAVDGRLDCSALYCGVMHGTRHWNALQGAVMHCMKHCTGMHFTRHWTLLLFTQPT